MRPGIQHYQHQGFRQGKEIDDPEEIFFSSGTERMKGEDNVDYMGNQELGNRRVYLEKTL